MLMAQKNSTIINGVEYQAEALTIVLFDGKYADNMWVVDFDEALINHKYDKSDNDTEF